VGQKPPALPGEIAGRDEALDSRAQRAVIATGGVEK
jgi:hypothetical protein